MFLKDCVSRAEMLADCEEFGLCEITVKELIDAGATKVTYESQWGYGHVGVWGLGHPKPQLKARRKIAMKVRIVEWPLFARGLDS